MTEFTPKHYQKQKEAREIPDSVIALIKSELRGEITPAKIKRILREKDLYLYYDQVNKIHDIFKQYEQDKNRK